MAPGAKKLSGGLMDLVGEKTLTATRQLPTYPADPLPKYLQRSGVDIVKKSSSRRARHMLVFNLQLSPLAGGRLGTLAQLDSQTPVLYIDFPQGRLKLFGTMTFPHSKYIVLQATGKKLLCEDVLESMIVFTEAWWVGTVEDNPGELRLPFPEELAPPGAAPEPAAAAATWPGGATPLAAKRARDEDDQAPPDSSDSRRTARRLTLEEDGAEGTASQASQPTARSPARPQRAAAQRASQQMAEDSWDEAGASEEEEEEDEW